MKKLFITLVFLAIITKSFGQGCIAVRSMACANGNVNSSSSFMKKGDFQFSTSFRKLHSYKHFVGTVEQKHRVEEAFLPAKSLGIKKA